MSSLSLESDTGGADNKHLLQGTKEKLSQEAFGQSLESETGGHSEQAERYLQYDPEVSENVQKIQGDQMSGRMRECVQCGQKRTNTIKYCHLSELLGQWRAG